MHAVPHDDSWGAQEIIYGHGARRKLYIYTVATCVTWIVLYGTGPLEESQWDSSKGPDNYPRRPPSARARNRVIKIFEEFWIAQNVKIRHGRPLPRMSNNHIIYV